MSLKSLCTRTCCFCFASQGGSYLVNLYLFIKFLFVVNVIGQLLLLNSFLGKDYNMYGVDVLGHIIQGTDWKVINTTHAVLTSSRESMLWIFVIIIICWRFTPFPSHHFLWPRSASSWQYSAIYSSVYLAGKPLEWDDLPVCLVLAGICRNYQHVQLYFLGHTSDVS